MIPTYSEISNYINTNDLNPWRLHASLSGHKYQYARDQIKAFFMDPNIDQVLYGTSSGDSRSHFLVRLNDIVYVYHYSWGRISDAFYFTEGELSLYFEGFENEMPVFKNQFLSQSHPWLLQDENRIEG